MTGTWYLDCTQVQFAEAAVISKADVQREIHAQMAAWHASATTPATAATISAQNAPPTDTLDHRIRLLEQELSGLQTKLKSENGQIAGLLQRATHDLAARGPLLAPASVAPLPHRSPAASFVPRVQGMGIIAAFVALYSLISRLGRRTQTLNAEQAGRSAEEVEHSVNDTSETHAKLPDADRVAVREHEAVNERAHESQDSNHMPPVVAASTSAPISRHEPESSTVNMSTVNLSIDTAIRSAEAARVNVTHVDTVRLDYNTVDLEMTVQHVQMPSVLNENVVLKERRTNLADVLKQALEREPERHDLRMKLLELHYAAAATNLQAFLEVAQKCARDRHHMRADEWNKIAFMGRQIAAGNPLFAEDADELANCA